MEHFYFEILRQLDCPNVNSLLNGYMSFHSDKGLQSETLGFAYIIPDRVSIRNELAPVSSFPLL